MAFVILGRDLFQNALIMITSITCSKPDQNTYTYTKENYPEFTTRIFPGYFHNYRSLVSWRYKDQTYGFGDKLLKHMPLKPWDGIAFIDEDFKSMSVCNADGSLRFEISVPENLIQIKTFQNHFSLTESEVRALSNTTDFKIQFERFDGYFEHNGSHYLSIKVGAFHKNNPHHAFLQTRYIDEKTGSLLPFTETIGRYVENQYSYNEETINL